MRHAAACHALTFWSMSSSTSPWCARDVIKTMKEIRKIENVEILTLVHIQTDAEITLALDDPNTPMHNTSPTNTNEYTNADIKTIIKIYENTNTSSNIDAWILVRMGIGIYPSPSPGPSTSTCTSSATNPDPNPDLVAEIGMDTDIDTSSNVNRETNIHLIDSLDFEPFLNDEWMGIAGDMSEGCG
ncbi:hypothetical protein DL95DRAFT_465261 [Leptodontidium sp. 2 PMI_412]|nr:hypothetical protein DL95DRAFT_465261 [Leptodontidium sp. 2 PMI_412]